MTTCRFENFDITIAGETPPYPVLVRFGGLEGTGSFHTDANDPAWAGPLAALSDAQDAPGEEMLTLVGGALFDELMQDGIRDLWMDARSVRRDNIGLRIRLALHAPAVAALPWETLADARRNQIFATDPGVSLVRVANLVDFVDRPRDLSTLRPVKLLIAAVDDPAGMDISRELTTIQQALAPLEPHALQVDTLAGRFGPLELRQRLERFQPNILHVISHGEPDGLYMWTQDGFTLVSSAQIAGAAQGIESLRLVFLNACLAGQADSELPYASLAHRLLQTGLPAVVAMQFEIEDEAAAIFASVVYEKLVAGDCPGMVDVAVRSARHVLHVRDANRADYVTPILWLNGDDGLLFDLDQEHAASREPPERLAKDAPRPSLEINIEEKERWFSRLPETMGPAEIRFDYTERRKQLERVLRLLRADHDALANGELVDLRRLRERLEVFEAERRYMEELLAWLSPDAFAAPES